MADRASSSSINYKYDVFLSFYGEDTRLGFTSHLHQALRQRGIRVFLDDECIRTGESITHSLFGAIEESRIAVIVFSGKYANSTFCLRELAKILECFKEESRLIYPVFYHVDPSELRNPRESYAEALAGLEERFRDKRHEVEKWRLALSRVADFKGCHLRPKIDNEQECITRITDDIATRMNQVPLDVTNYPVGLVPRVKDVISYLDLWSTQKIKIKLELEQYISLFKASSFSQREICDPPFGDGVSASVHVSSNRIANERECIKRIINEVATRMNQEPLDVTNYPAGLVSRVKEFISYLDIWSTEKIKIKLELEQYIRLFEASSFSQREICDLPIGYGGSASVHVASNRVTRDLNAVKKEDAAAANSISESTDFSIWEKGDCIGIGAWGIVYVARNSYKKHVVFFISDRETRALCAVKELRDIHEHGINIILYEIKILSQLEHTNIIKYYGHEIVGRHISLYMEFVQPGSLKKYISERGFLPEPLIRNFTAQILSGLAYLHSKRVVHRDIKPCNLLVDSNNIVKLVDFGLAKQLEESVGDHSVVGTLYYAAPEVLGKRKYQSLYEAFAADIWSLGCVIIEMFSGMRPKHLDMTEVISDHVEQQHPLIPEKLCQQGNDFLKLCFTRNPADRPSASALLDHPFVKPLTTSLADGREYN